MDDKKIIAVDFDGTLFTEKYPLCGKPNWKIIKKCKELQDKNYCLVLWTCRSTREDLEEAIDMCKSVGLYFKYVNENPQWAIDKWGIDSRKIGATWYLDDKNISFEEFLKL